MSQSELCRVCAKLAKTVNSQKLFERSQRKLLRQLEELTGRKLKSSKELPQSICENCLEDLQQAHAFRERCIASQKYYASTAYRGRDVKRKARHKQAIEKPPDRVQRDDLQDELPIEESLLTKMYGIKKETADKSVEQHGPANIQHAVEDQLPTVNLHIVEVFSLKEEKGAEFIDCAVDDNNDNSETIGTAPSEELDERLEIRISHTKAEAKSGNGSEKLEPSKTRKPRGGRHTSTFICDQCGNHFTCRHHFATHLRRHIGDKRHECEICPDKFYTPSELKRHMRKHTGERPFACNYCERRFSDYSTRVKHERTHTNARPFLCKQCGKAFTTPYILKNHMLVHTGERSFRCDLCNKAFQRQSHLVVHERSIMHKQLKEAQQKPKL